MNLFKKKTNYGKIIAISVACAAAASALADQHPDLRR